MTYSFDDDSAAVGPSSSGRTSKNISSSNGAAGRGSSSYGANATAGLEATKLALFGRLAALDRGVLATRGDAEEVERLVARLEAAGGAAPFEGSPAPVEGRWELVYANTEVFRASPFFLAFQNGLVQDKHLADAIFAFTDAIPGAEVGAARQTVSLLSGSLISEVDLRVFPTQLLSGSVVTTSRCEVLGPRSLGLTIESTRVAGSLLPIDSVAVPVKALFEALRGEGATRAVYEVTFVDAALRVTRAGEQLLIHRRM